MGGDGGESSATSASVVAASSAPAAPSASTSTARSSCAAAGPVVVGDSPVKRSISSAARQPWSRVSSSPSRPMASTPAAWSRKCHVRPSWTRRSCSSSRPATCSSFSSGEVTDQVGPAPLQQLVLGPVVPLLDDRARPVAHVGGVGRGEPLSQRRRGPADDREQPAGLRLPGRATERHEGGVDPPVTLPEGDAVEQDPELGHELLDDGGLRRRVERRAPPRHGLGEVHGLEGPLQAVGLPLAHRETVPTRAGVQRRATAGSRRRTAGDGQARNGERVHSSPVSLRPRTIGVPVRLATVTGCGNPAARSRRGGCAVTPSGRSIACSAGTSTSPGPAASHRRAARLTAEPM